MRSLLPSPTGRDFRDSAEGKVRVMAMTVLFGRARYVATNALPRPIYTVELAMSEHSHVFLGEREESTCLEQRL